MRREDYEAAGLALDADALDQIAELLRRQVWDASLVPIIAEIVRSTDRDPDDGGEE